MAHAAVHSHSPQELKETRKKYFKVFAGLIALTIVELIIVYLPINKTIITLGVAVFSSAKAVVVGYYYMHLEHETRWLQWVACLPIIAFGYAFVLMYDTPARPISHYWNEPARVFRGEAHHEEAEHEGGEFPADLEKIEGDVLKVEGKSGRGGALELRDKVEVPAQSSEAAGHASPAAAGAGATESAPAKAEAGGGEWN